MSREYDLKFNDEYEISRHRYRELKEFCLQYEEKKEKLKQLYSLSSAPPEVPVMGGTPGNPTERKAMRALQLKNDIEIIESTLRATCGDDIGIMESLKKNVTLGYGYNKLGYVPCGKNQFFEYRRKFYFFLDKIKNGDNGVILS